MPAFYLRWALALSLVVVEAAGSDFDLLGDGFCHGPTGSLVAGLSGGWQPTDSAKTCEAQCAKASACDGFEFEDGKPGCRLLKGSIERSSNDHGKFNKISCYINAKKAKAAKAQADAERKSAQAKEEAKRNKEFNEMLAPSCNMFSCPANQTRAPKLGFAPWSYGCSYSEDAGLQECCFVQDVCFHTCGMSSRACYNNFMQCVQKVGGPEARNPGSSFSKAIQINKEPGMTKEERCNHYEDAQIEACDCVTHNTFRSRVEQWLRRFYAKHQPDKLDESKKLKNSTQIWDKWTNKEPELLFALAKKYKGAVELRSVDNNEAQYLVNQLGSAVANEDYFLAKRIKRRQALVKRKLETIANIDNRSDSTATAADASRVDDAGAEGTAAVGARDDDQTTAKEPKQEEMKEEL